jgi:hypothetical protein
VLDYTIISIYSHARVSWEEAYLGGLTGEVVGRLESTADALLERSITAVVSAENRVLEASGVADVDVELAVLAGVGDGDAGADGRDVAVEDEGDGGAVLGDLGAHGALGASGSAIGDTLDGDLFVGKYVPCNKVKYNVPDQLVGHRRGRLGQGWEQQQQELGGG